MFLLRKQRKSFDHGIRDHRRHHRWFHPKFFQRLVWLFVFWVFVTIYLMYARDPPKLQPREPSIAQPTILRTNDNRGIVMCVYDGIFALSLSLVLELRCLGNTDPIELAFCGDELSDTSQAAFRLHDPSIRFLDICQNMHLDPVNHHKYRNYWIKPLAVLHSSFDRVMLMDADAIFIRDPADLWTHPEVARTGTLLFRDKHFAATKFLGKRMTADKIPWIRYIFQHFNVTPYLHLAGVGSRWSDLRPGDAPEPSKSLTESVPWEGKSGHYLESSLLIWHKSLQPRATAILSYIVTSLRFDYPNFSWGDKDCFFLPFEFAQSDYYLEPWALSAISGHLDMKHPDTLCGNAGHWYPDEQLSFNGKPELLYVNGKSILQYDMPTKTTANRKPYNQFNALPSHITPRHRPIMYAQSKHGGHCLTDLGSQVLPIEVRNAFARRRAFYNTISLNSSYGLDTCG